MNIRRHTTQIQQLNMDLNVVVWGVQNVATGGWGNTATNVWKRPTTELGSGSWVFPNDILWSTGVVSRFSLHQQNVCDWTLTFCRYTSYFPSPTMPQAASGLESPPWIGDNYTYGNGMYYFDISIRITDGLARSAEFFKL